MADFLFNPRRAPRAPVRCRAEVTGADGARWSADTEDVGPRGCQIVAPRRRPQGEPLLMVISADGLPRTLRVGGKVAWVSAGEPWRLGVAFSEQDSAVATDWYGALVARTPALAAYRGVPDRIALDATLFLGPPPRLVVDFTRDELQILRSVGSGIAAGELRARLRDTWDRAQHALFSLIVRRHIVLARGASVLPATWKQLLAELEATLAVEELGRAAPTAPGPVVSAAPRSESAPAPKKVAPPAPVAPSPVAPAPTPASSRSRETRASMRAIDAGGAWAGGHEPKHDGSTPKK